MAFPSRSREKPVWLIGFNNEPMARLAEQRLRQMGIPCFVRSLHGGPGLWGSAYNLPHDLLVYESDATQARDVLDLEPQLVSDWDRPDHQQPSASNLWPVLAGAALIMMVLLAVVSVLSQR